MNPLEHRLDYPLADHLPAPATRTEVAPGLFWIRMPLPFALDHINLWLLEDEFQGRRGYTLVDCGVASQQIRELWDRLIATGLDGLPIVRVLCTHTHPDHVGLARMLTDLFEVPLWMTLGEYALGRVLSAVMPGANGDSAAAHFALHGLQAEKVEAIRKRNQNYFASLVPGMPLSFRRIREDEPVRIGRRSFRIVIGTGHSPEHAALYSEADGVLISGDMVLPRISTNCSVFDIEPESNPVDWYLSSLRKFEPCRADTLVLPSHGRPFTKLHERLHQLYEHHDERFDMVRAACRRRPQSAADIVPVMFKREFDTHQTTFALGEALAHLHALWYRGELARGRGGDGVIRFAAA